MEQIEMIAAAKAHRACCGSEHDPAQGKLHGYCVVCGVPWPCDTAKRFLTTTDPLPDAASMVSLEVVEEVLRWFEYQHRDGTRVIPATANEIMDAIRQKAGV